MKKTMLFSVLSLLLILGGTTVCFAKDTSTYVQSFGLDFKDYNLNYTEVDTGGKFLDSEWGWLNGLKLSYKIQNSVSKSFCELNYELTNKQTNFNGLYQYNGPAVTSITSNQITNLEALYGFPVGLKNGYIVAGIGLHRWNRDLSETQKGEYSWFYLPIGYRWEFGANNKLGGAIDITARFMAEGKLKVYDSYYDTFEVELGNRLGYKIELPLLYKVDSSWAITVMPWYEYSNIAVSNQVPLTHNGLPTSYGAWEPDSRTYQSGIDIGVKFTF